MEALYEARNATKAASLEEADASKQKLQAQAAQRRDKMLGASLVGGSYDESIWFRRSECITAKEAS